MVHPVNSAYTEEYILRSDAKSEKPTIFIVGVLDSLLKLHIDDEHTTLSRLVNGTKMNDKEIHDKYLEFVRYGLRGWHNFKKADGSDVPFNTEMVDVPKVGSRIAVTNDTLQWLDATDLMEIGMRISMLNTISREQRKN